MPQPLEGYVREIVMKMFEIAGHPFSDSIDFQDLESPWYSKITWTAEQEEEFFDWFRAEAKARPKLRRFLGVVGQSKKEIDRKTAIWRLYCPTIIREGLANEELED